jgi:branched-chain amino acid transport system permease protein
MTARGLLARPLVLVAGLSLWAGLLAFPFTGLVRAAGLAGISAASFALWRLIKATRGAATAVTAPAASPKEPAIRPGFRVHGQVPSVLAILSCAVIPFFLNDYYCDVLTLAGIYTVLALGLNIVVGQAGLLNLGYVAFYAVGAYTYAILSTRYGLAFWPGVIVGSLSAAIFSAVLGTVTLRLRGDYFAIVTLGLGEITRIVLNNWDSMTGGPNGIANIGRPVLFGYAISSPRDSYLLIFFAVLIVLFGMGRLVRSRIGRAWIAIREDEIAAEAMGINTFRLKLLAFVLASAIAGAAGAFFAAKMAFVSPESFTFMESVLILCMVVLGGMGSIPGTVLGAILLVTLPEVFRDFQDFRMMAFGIALVALMIFRPQGLMGTVRQAR